MTLAHTDFGIVLHLDGIDLAVDFEGLGGMSEVQDSPHMRWGWLGKEGEGSVIIFCNSVYFAEIMHVCVLISDRPCAVE